MLRTHYRQPIDWTVKALEEAEATLDRWYEAVGDVEARGDPDEDVLDALADDLNTPELPSQGCTASRTPRRRDGDFRPFRDTAERARSAF